MTFCWRISRIAYSMRSAGIKGRLVLAIGESDHGHGFQDLEITKCDLKITPILEMPIWHLKMGNLEITICDLKFLEVVTVF